MQACYQKECASVKVTSSFFIARKVLGPFKKRLHEMKLSVP